MYKLSDFDFTLPPELIAQVPAPTRSASRLLDVTTSGLVDRRFVELPRLLAEGDLVIFNDTRVIRARLHGIKPSGGRVEILIERLLAHDRALVQLRASHLPRQGGVIAFDDGAQAEVIARDDRFFELLFHRTGPLLDWLGRQGEVPLPPYITHPAGDEDAERYQTVYANAPGAVAAPTAGLHFDLPLLGTLRERGIDTAFLTLHVGAGTFQPVTSDDISHHRMHSEWFDIPRRASDAIEHARSRGGRIVAVGTTTLRALESAASDDGSVRAGAGETTLFITPGHRFRVVDRLLTNFHLPRSTLLMLVSAFAGYQTIQAAYAHAVRERYRFFSYGDAMLLKRAH